MADHQATHDSEARRLARAWYEVLRSFFAETNREDYESAAQDALDELVFELVGTSQRVSDEINNAGWQRQIEAIGAEPGGFDALERRMVSVVGFFWKAELEAQVRNTYSTLTAQAREQGTSRSNNPDRTYWRSELEQLWIVRGRVGFEDYDTVEICEGTTEEQATERFTSYMLDLAGVTEAEEKEAAKASGRPEIRILEVTNLAEPVGRHIGS